MTATINLLKLLGKDPPRTVNTFLLKELNIPLLFDLYTHARTNKLEYTFLKSLEYNSSINRIPQFKQRLTELNNIYRKFVESICNISESLNDLNIEHAFIKTIFPFPALPSDIDVLLLNSKLSIELINKLKSKGLIPFDKGPHFVSLYNTNVDSSTPREKQSFDIDLYDEISLSYFIYIDKGMLLNGVKYITFERCNIPVFENFYDLLIHLNHSVYEHLFTLLHIYTYLFFYDRNKSQAFVDAVYNSRSLFIMEKISSLIRCVLDGKCELPYRFSMNDILVSLVEKASYSKYRSSLIELFTDSLINPLKTHHILFHLLYRRIRTTY